MQDIARREAEERARLEKAERAKRERRCPTCEMKVAMMVTMMGGESQNYPKTLAMIKLIRVLSPELS